VAAHPLSLVGEAGERSLLLHPVLVPVPVNLPAHHSHNSIGRVAVIPGGRDPDRAVFQLRRIIISDSDVTFLAILSLSICMRCVNVHVRYVGGKLMLIVWVNINPETMRPRTAEGIFGDLWSPK